MKGTWKGLRALAGTEPVDFSECLLVVGSPEHRLWRQPRSRLLRSQPQITRPLDISHLTCKMGGITCAFQVWKQNCTMGASSVVGAQ